MLKITRKGLLPAIACGALCTVSTPSLAYAGQVISNDMGQCYSTSGPAVLIELRGFKTSGGTIRVQSYRANKAEWLEKGRWLSRIELDAKPVNGVMRVCVPVPSAGSYGIAVRHDINGNGKTDIWKDGGGFSNNPKANLFNLGKPPVDKVAINVGRHPISIAIRLQYM
ncbi:MAG: DUF2141 domain-containing protein [Sphingobium sp.]